MKYVFIAFAILLPMLLMAFKQDGGTSTIQNPFGEGHYAKPSWSPNGQHLAFFFEEDLWLMDIKDGNLTEYPTRENGSYSYLAWRDNSTLWVTVHRYSTGLQDSEPRDMMLSLDIDSGRIQQVLTDEQLPESIRSGWAGYSFNPYDRNLLAISSCLPPRGNPNTCDEPTEIYLVDVSTSIASQLTHTSALWEGAPQWSSDGKKLAFTVTDRTRKPGTELSSKEGTVIFENGVSTLLPFYVGSEQHRWSWSPESLSIVFKGSYRETGLFRLAIDGLQEPQLLLEVPVAYVSWSFDGQYIAYSTIGMPSSNELYILSATEIENWVTHLTQFDSTRYVSVM